MPQLGREPNTSPTQQWSVHWSVQDAGEGLAALRKMQQQGLEPNLITYLVASGACRKCRMPGKALQLFDKMQQQGLGPHRITYIAVSSACEKCRRPVRAWQLFNERQQQGLEPN